MSRFYRILLITCMFLALAGSPLYAQTVTSVDKVIDYQLPYPGILPDNPLYFFKEMRDNLQITFATNPIAKANTYLQLSDKYMSAAVALTKKGKHKMAEEQMVKAQGLIEKIISLIEKQGAKMTTEEKSAFLPLFRKANLKHRETIETLMKDAPTGQVEQLEKLRQKNINLQKKIDLLK